MAVILGRKQLLVKLLNLANSLKKESDIRLLEDQISQQEYDELNTIWQHAFAALIRESLAYTYIPSKDNSKDIVRLVIDSVQYDCPAASLRKILKNDYDKFIVTIEETDNDDEIELIENQTVVNKTQKEIELEAELNAIKQKAEEQSKKLLYEVNHDATTKLKNKKAFLETMYNLEGDYIIASIDVNGLKFINDTYGHSAGDVLLNDVASVLRESFMHCSYRIGGDEFAIITNEKREIFELKLESFKNTLLAKKRSVSIGYAVSEDGLTAEEVYNIADSRMYDEKSIYKASQQSENYQQPQAEYSETVQDVIDIKLTNCEADENVDNGTIYNNRYEKMKDISSFVYDTYDLTLLAPGATTGEKIKAIIAPLRMAENDSHPEIMAMLVNNKGDIQEYVSNGGLSSLKVPFGDNEFLMRGNITNGEFKSFIVPSGATLSMGYNLNKNANFERRSTVKEDTQFGHIVFDAFGYVFHIVPISNTNDENGIAQCLICVENPSDNNTRVIFRTEQRAFTLFEDYQILTYWQDSLLCAEVVRK